MQYISIKTFCKTAKHCCDTPKLEDVLSKRQDISNTFSTFYCSLQQSGGSALNRSTISSGPSGRSYNALKSFASLFKKNS